MRNSFTLSPANVAQFCAVALGSLALLIPLAVGQQSSSASPREQLQQYVAQLQQNPSDNDLREKIIKLALTIKPAPKPPEEARKHFVIGTTLAKDAKNTSDFQSAADEYQKALLVAPWWGEAYWDLAIALQGAEKYDGAKQAIHLYLNTNPKPEDARAAQDRLYVLDAKQKEQANQGSAQQQAAGGQGPASQTTPLATPSSTQAPQFPDALAGRWYVRSIYDELGRSNHTTQPDGGACYNVGSISIDVSPNHVWVSGVLLQTMGPSENSEYDFIPPRSLRWQTSKNGGYNNAYNWTWTVNITANADATRLDIRTRMDLANPRSSTYQLGRYIYVRGAACNGFVDQ